MNDSVNNSAILKPEAIQSLIYAIRGKQVMIDRNLANLYGVETKVFNQAVKRNLNRFPDSFRFQLRRMEYNEILKSQNVTSSEHGGRRYLPWVFTEQGVAMLSAVLRSERAIQVSIQIMEAFVGMRKFLASHAGIFQRLGALEKLQLEQGEQIGAIFKAIEQNETVPPQAIFFDGQFFDAYQLVSDIIRSAKKSIILIDNYIDDSVLLQLSKRKANLPITIYTKSTSPILRLDVKRFNAQYPWVTIKTVENFHDRYLIIDHDIVYHFGASLKDLGKKTFSFTKLDLDPEVILSRVEIARE